MSARPPLVGISLKAYFDRSRALAWAQEVARLATDGAWDRDVTVFVLPDLLSVPPLVASLAGTGVLVGAQDVSASGYGATTGDVPAARLADEGCALVAVGHAERRRLHGETDKDVAAKVARATAAGLVPVVCVGEQERGTASAAATCRAQVGAALREAPEDARVLVAYEPVWAIGAQEPAEVGYVRDVVDALRTDFGRCEFLYGGSAKPGLLTDLGDSVDGIFLGRFGHDPAALASVVDEARSRRPPAPQPR